MMTERTCARSYARKRMEAVRDDGETARRVSRRASKPETCQGGLNQGTVKPGGTGSKGACQSSSQRPLWTSVLTIEANYITNRRQKR